MLPLRDENPTRRFPVVNLTLIAINVLVFIYELTLSSGQLEAFFLRWAVVPARVVYDFTPGTALTLITSMFMHGSLLHILGNMLYLFIFGDNIEDVVGHVRYLIVYVVAGVGASLAQIAVAPDSPIPALGASGAIAGVLGAYLVFFPYARVQYLVAIGFFVRFIEMPAVVALGGWFVLQFFSGLLSLASVQSGGVAWFAHIGGFIIGILVGLGCKAMGCRVRRPALPLYDQYLYR